MPEKKKPSRGAVLFMRTLIAAEVLFLVLVLSLWLAPEQIPAALALAGRSEYCSLGDVWRGGPLRLELLEAEQRIRESARLVEKDDEGYELWATSEGDYWVPAESGGSLPTLLAQQAVNQYGDGPRSVEEGDVVLDGGAHIGIYVREALGRGAKLVVAIEPAPNNVECLRRNLADEIARGRVIVYPKGIWDTVDELPLWEDPDNSAADGFIHKAEDFEAKHVIPLVPIDLLVDELELERVDLIKMDIKGAAAKALHGARETLSRDQPKLVIAAEDGDEPDVILATVEELAPGYDTRCSGCSVTAGWRIVPDILLLGPEGARPRRAQAP